jgi:hypothetical protein
VFHLCGIYIYHNLSVTVRNRRRKNVVHNLNNQWCVRFIVRVGAVLCAGWGGGYLWNARKSCLYMVPNFNRSVTTSCRMGSKCWNHAFSSFFRSPHCRGDVHASSVCSLSESVRWYHGSLSACVDSTTAATLSRMLMKD